MNSEGQKSAQLNDVPSSTNSNYVPPIEILNTKMYNFKTDLVKIMMSVVNGNLPISELNTPSTLTLLKNYEKAYANYTCFKRCKTQKATKWQDHFDIDSEIRENYMDFVYQPGKAMGEYSEWLGNTREEMEKFLKFSDMRDAHYFYTKSNKDYLPPNQVNMTMLKRLGDEMPGLLDVASGKSSNSKGHVDLETFPEVTLVKNNATNINTSNQTNLTPREEFLLAKKNKAAYNPEKFSPADSLLRTWDYNYRKQNDPILNKDYKNFDELTDIERLRITLGFDKVYDSPLTSILNNGKLPIICAKVYEESGKNQNLVRYVAEQETRFLRAFNSCFTWPVICSQIMPKISKTSKFRQTEMTISEYVSSKLGDTTEK